MAAFIEQGIIMKSAVKYTFMISGIVSLCLSCLFSSPVYADSYSVNLSYSTTGFIVLEEEDHEYEFYDLDSWTSYTNMNIYIESGTAGATDSVDPNFPAFVVADSSYHSNSNAIPMNRKCLEFSELSSIWVNTNGATGNQYANNVIDWLMDLNPLSTYESGSSYIKYEVLYKLGYRVTSYCQTTSTTSNVVYLYTLQKLQGSDHLNFLNSDTETHYTVTELLHEFDHTSYFLRFDFNTFNLTKRSDNSSVNFNDGDYIEYELPIRLNWKTNRNDDVINNYYIYSYNDLSIKLTPNNMQDSQGSFLAGYTVTCYITGKNPYIVFYQSDVNSGYIDRLTVTQYQNQYAMLYQGAGSDLTSINQHLVTIEDLLSDLQVTEINNIYQDITNEYDVDIDLSINNIIDDLKLHINDFDFTDPSYQIPETDLQKITGFRLIFSNMIQTMNTNGLGLMWFLPLVLLVIGALL